MTLPIITYPITIITVPSTKNKLKFRPFITKEEKLLLMAKESDNGSDILLTIKQIVNNCCLEKKVDISKLTIFDLEYIFLKLRAISVDNICKVSYTDSEDNKIYDFEINLNNIEVVFPEKIDNIIKINDTMGIVMKYPSASLYDDQDFLKLEKHQFFELIVRCVDKIYEEDNIFEANKYKKEEISEFIDKLPTTTFTKIKEFLTTVPSMKYIINYKNSLGHDRKIELSSLNDFFTFR